MGEAKRRRETAARYWPKRQEDLAAGDHGILVIGQAETGGMDPGWAQIAERTGDAVRVEIKARRVRTRGQDDVGSIDTSRPEVRTVSIREILPITAESFTEAVSGKPHISVDLMLGKDFDHRDGRWIATNYGMAPGDTLDGLAQLALDPRARDANAMQSAQKLIWQGGPAFRSLFGHGIGDDDLFVLRAPGVGGVGGDTHAALDVFDAPTAAAMLRDLSVKTGDPDYAATASKLEDGFMKEPDHVRCLVFIEMGHTVLCSVSHQWIKTGKSTTRPN